jgi:hypothetical protein
MENTCRATITFGDSKIIFEGSSEFVQEQVEKFAGRANASTPGDTGELRRPIQGSAEKQLITQKRPRGHHEIVTVLAFALSEAGMKEFGEDDIRRAYIRAEVRPPKHVSQALRDAKSKWDFITSGSRRGMYRLANNGDRVVRFDLPRPA